MRESTYQRRLINKLEFIFPGCVVIKNDPSQNQGFPDLLILFEDQWAMLEVKIDGQSPEQPNQFYYIDLFDQMSFAAFINPSNEEQVLDDLQSAFGTERKTRFSKS